MFQKSLAGIPIRDKKQLMRRDFIVLYIYSLSEPLGITLKVWNVFCFGKDFLVKSNLTYGLFLLRGKTFLFS